MVTATRPVRVRGQTARSHVTHVQVLCRRGSQPSGATSRRRVASLSLPAGRACFPVYEATCGDGGAHRASNMDAPRLPTRSVAIMPALIPMHCAGPRKRCPSRSSASVGRRAASRTSRSRPRLGQQGFGTVQRAFLCVFGHMKGLTCQRGSRSRQTGVMVLRLGISM